MEQRRITDLTDIELKAIAYDALAAIQVNQNNLNVINQELTRRVQANPPPQGSPFTEIPPTQPPTPSVIPRLGHAHNL